MTKKNLFSLISLLLISSLVFAQKDFKTVAYYTPNTPPSAIPFENITHLNYSFAIPAKTGDTLIPLKDDSILKELVPLAHENGVEVFISVGGWGIGDGGGEDGRFHRMAETPKGRATFINSTMDFVEKYNLDGVDLDWEYPDPDHRSADDYILLCKDLYTALHKRGGKLTAAVVSKGKQAYGIKEEVYPYMDWLNIMVYDGDYGPKELKHHSPYSMAVICIDFWLNERNLPAEKCVLGLPFYAKKGHGNFGFTYKQLLEAGASHYDDYWNGHYYNGTITIANKTKLAMDKKLGGVMVWELSCDTTDEYSLFKTIHETILEK
ncbi:glycosyl hydrolase family 18 protein [uncultured Arcticibacterium sp.]|uniref:glycosyl hydrolase family 18 protein n=1 Tax=uncultured Arcticibacterium sp. TaxID=2173042 RepID=UPI0030F61250